MYVMSQTITELVLVVKRDISLFLVDEKLAGSVTARAKQWPGCEGRNEFSGSVQHSCSSLSQSVCRAAAVLQQPRSSVVLQLNTSPDWLLNVWLYFKIDKEFYSETEKKNWSLENVTHFNEKAPISLS